jgi:hypothetical protein
LRRTEKLGSIEDTTVIGDAAPADIESLDNVEQMRVCVPD